MSYALLVAEYGVAIGTIGLAAMTYVSLRAEKWERSKLAFRGAMFECLENCRHWFVHDWTFGATAVGPLVGWVPCFDEQLKLLQSVNLPSELVSHLAWQIAAAQDDVERLQPELSQAVAASDTANLRMPWLVILERFQVIGCLIRAESERQHLRDVALSFESPWSQPYVCPLEVRRTVSPVGPRTRFDPPPLTDRAYAACTAEARDQEAHKSGAGRPVTPVT